MKYGRYKPYSGNEAENFNLPAVGAWWYQAHENIKYLMGVHKMGIGIRYLGFGIQYRF
jgi:hypothetical protein